MQKHTCQVVQREHCPRGPADTKASEDAARFGRTLRSELLSINHWCMQSGTARAYRACCAALPSSELTWRWGHHRRATRSARRRALAAGVRPLAERGCSLGCQCSDACSKLLTIIAYNQERVKQAVRFTVLSRGFIANFSPYHEWPCGSRRPHTASFSDTTS